MTSSAIESNSKKSRRWWQLSIRTLLILSAILAITVGVFFRRVRTQGQAVTQIENLGGSVTYQDTWLGECLPESIRESVGDHYVANAVSASLSPRAINGRSTPPSQDELRHFVDAARKLPKVTTLKTYSLNLSDEDLAIFTPLRKQIEELSVYQPHCVKFHGSRLDLLSGWKQLRSLSICSNGLYSDEQPDQLNIAPLSKLPQLEQITLGRGDFNLQVFEDLSKLTRLKHISFSSSYFEGSHLAFLQKLQYLETLTLHNTHPEVKRGPYRIRQDGTRHYFEEPTFRFERSDDSHMGQPKSGFPQEKYNKWIKETMGEVQVIQWFIT